MPIAVSANRYDGHFKGARWRTMDSPDRGGVFDRQFLEHRQSYGNFLGTAKDFAVKFHFRQTKDLVEDHQWNNARL
jgi:hypothetical protein